MDQTTAVNNDNKREDQSLAREMKALKVISEIGLELSSRIDLDEAGIISLVDQQLSALMDACDMYIALYNEEADEVCFPVMRVNGESREMVPRKGGQGRAEMIIHTRSPLVFTTLAESEAWYQHPGRTKYIECSFSSWLGVPMITRNHVIGVIAIFEVDRKNRYDEDDLKVLQVVAGLAAIAVGNVRLYGTSERIVQKRTEELLQIDKQLKEGNEELRRIQDQQVLVALGQATAGLIHKMSNTLGPIPFFWVDQIESSLSPNDEILRKPLHRIRDNTRDALAYVDGMSMLLTSRQVGREQRKLEFLLRGVLENMHADIVESVIDVESNLDDVGDIPAVWIMTSLISEAFQNIIRNAIQAMPDGGKLMIHLERIGEKTLQIAIKDTGVGIPENKQKNIFTPGFSTKKEGKGLGLWFSQAVVKQHNGSISFESQEGVGTAFRVVLPIEAPFASAEVS